MRSINFRNRNVRSVSKRAFGTKFPKSIPTLIVIVSPSAEMIVVGRRSFPGTIKSPGASSGTFRTESIVKAYWNATPTWPIFRPLVSGTALLNELLYAAKISSRSAVRNSPSTPRSG